MTITIRKDSRSVSLTSLSYGGYSKYGTIDPTPNTGETLIGIFAMTGGGIPVPCCVTPTGKIAVVAAGTDNSVTVVQTFIKQG